MSSIAFVGAGPTSIYTLLSLVNEASVPFSVTIFEQQAVLGRGTPYRPGWNDPAMLSNIASIEIPKIEQTLVEWLRALPAARLRTMKVAPADIGERTFYPRLVLGEYLSDQCAALLLRAKSRGIRVIVRPNCRVTDAVSQPDGMMLTVQPKTGPMFQERFDHVVMATGHQWPDAPEVRPGYFLSPWPASALKDVPPCKVGIRGSSLTAIDAALALAVLHGSFDEGNGCEVTYEPNADTNDFHMTMMSRKGLLPEADLYVPLPYEPLRVFTPGAIEQLIQGPNEDLLNHAYALFKDELIAADSNYAEKIGLPNLALEEFHTQYFADRAASDPFDWAQKNLNEAEFNYQHRISVAWRYAILRMHEVLEPLVAHFSEEDFERFSQLFKPVFVDNYATVPHKSIRRMLALHRAGKLDTFALGEDYRIDSYRPEGGVVLKVNGQLFAYPIFIEAIGQKPLKAKDFPFRSLIQQGVVHDAETSISGASRGIAIDDEFHPISDHIPSDQLFCLSLPFILGRHPFHQGITSSHEMGELVGEQLAKAISRDVEAAISREEIGVSS